MEIKVKNAVKMYRHESLDWCHFCGIRKQGDLVDIFYSKNAEHRRGRTSEYVRICLGCMAQLHTAAIKLCK